MSALKNPDSREGIEINLAKHFENFLYKVKFQGKLTFQKTDFSKRNHIHSPIEYKPSMQTSVCRHQIEPTVNPRQK